MTEKEMEVTVWAAWAMSTLGLIGYTAQWLEAWMPFIVGVITTVVMPQTILAATAARALDGEWSMAMLLGVPAAMTLTLVAIKAVSPRQPSDEESAAASRPAAGRMPGRLAGTAAHQRVDSVPTQARVAGATPASTRRSPVAAEYMRDPQGTVHVMAPWSGGDFTWCDQPVVDAGIDPEDGDVFGEGQETRSAGPATCPECRRAADMARRSLRGVRWR